MFQSRVGSALFRSGTLVAVLGTAALQFGAAPAKWPYIPKGDRPASIADCRGVEDAARVPCAGVVLVAETTDGLRVGPGLSIVERRSLN